MGWVKNARQINDMIEGEYTNKSNIEIISNI